MSTVLCGAEFLCLSASRQGRASLVSECLSGAEDRRHISGAMENCDDLNASGIFAVHDQIRTDGPESHAFGRQVSSRVPGLGPGSELLEGFKELID